MRKLSLTFIATSLILAAFSYGQTPKMPASELSPVKCRDVRKLADIGDRNLLKDSLMKLIASDDFGLPFFVKNDCNVFAELFKINDHVRPVLRSTLDNPEIFPQSAKLLLYFTDEEDRSLLIEKLDSHNNLNKAQINQVRLYVAGGSISPKSEREWALLKSMVTCEEPDMDWFLIEGAALALAAIGGDRALSILKATPICKRPPAAESAVRLAIKWVNKHPQPVESFSELKKSIIAASKIFNYSGKQDRFHIEKIVNDRANEKALVFCTVDAGGEYYYYELVFQRRDDIWVLKGIWSTGFAF